MLSTQVSQWHRWQLILGAEIRGTRARHIIHVLYTDGQQNICRYKYNQTTRYHWATEQLETINKNHVKYITGTLDTIFLINLAAGMRCTPVGSADLTHLGPKLES